MSNNIHILVVDDEPDIRESFQEYLEINGYRVSCADGAAEARRLVGEHDIDVALLDISMPGEDGLSLARYLREHTDGYDPIEDISPAESRMLYNQHAPTATRIEHDAYGWQMWFDTMRQKS